MPRYKPAQRNGIFVPVVFEEQIQPGTFEFALHHLVNFKLPSLVRVPHRQVLRDNAANRHSCVPACPLMNAISPASVMIVSLLPSVCAASDPLQDFEQLVSTCQAGHLAPTSRVTLQSEGKWLKRIEHPVSVKYDVKKTDSLVSPLTAYIESTTIGVGQRADSEEEAKTLTPSLDGLVSQFVLRINYAYRAGKWTLVDGVGTLTWRNRPSDGFRDPGRVTQSATSLLKLGAPWSACIRE